MRKNRNTEIITTTTTTTTKNKPIVSENAKKIGKEILGVAIIAALKKAGEIIIEKMGDNK